MKSLKNLTSFDFKVDLKLEDVTGHSQSIVTNADNLGHHTSSINNESEQVSVPEGAILSDFNEVHVDNDIVFFRYKSILPDRACHVYKYGAEEFIVPAYLGYSNRSGRSDGFEEPNYDPKEWVDAIEKVFGMSRGTMASKGAGMSAYPEFLKGTKQSFSAFIDFLLRMNIITQTGKAMYFFDRLHGDELTYFNLVIDRPEKFVVNTRNMSLFDGKNVLKDDKVLHDRTITDAYLETLKARPNTRSLSYFKGVAKKLCTSHRYEGNENEMVIAMYYICAGLDDYDTKEVFESVSDSYECNSLKEGDVFWKVAMLQFCMPYSNNTASYHYGKNSKQHAEEYLDQSDFEKTDLVILEFEHANVYRTKTELDRLIVSTKFDLASFELEYKGIV